MSFLVVGFDLAQVFAILVCLLFWVALVCYVLRFGCLACLVIWLTSCDLSLWVLRCGGFAVVFVWCLL